MKIELIFRTFGVGERTIHLEARAHIDLTSGRYFTTSSGNRVDRCLKKALAYKREWHK